MRLLPGALVPRQGQQGQSQHHLAAGGLICRLAAGGDVLAERTQRREQAARRKAAPTLGAALDLYRDDRLRHLRSGAHAEQVIRLVFGPLLAKSLADLSKADMLDAVARKRKTAPATAETALRYARPLTRWISEAGHGANRLDGVRAQQTRRRDRVLTLEELGRVLVALDGMGAAAGALAARTLVATAGRLNEVSGMRWDELDPGRTLWTLPPERNKSARVHLVPLNAEAREAIAMTAESGDLVFTGRTGSTAFSGWSRFKARLDEASGVSDWVLHDCRRTFASICADRGVDAVVCDRVLNHAASGTLSTVARVYQRSEMIEQRRAALDLWSAVMAEARQVAASGNVVALASSKRSTTQASLR